MLLQTNILLKSLLKLGIAFKFSENEATNFAKENERYVELFLLYSVGAFYIVLLYSMVMINWKKC